MEIIISIFVWNFSQVLCYLSKQFELDIILIVRAS